MSTDKVAIEYTALKIRVEPEVMSFFISKLSQKIETICKRVFESEWVIKEVWCKEPTYIEQWKLEVLASMSRRYNWAFFLLEKDNLPKDKQ